MPLNVHDADIAALAAAIPDPEEVAPDPPTHAGTLQLHAFGRVCLHPPEGGEHHRESITFTGEPAVIEVLARVFADRGEIGVLIHPQLRGVVLTLDEATP